MMPAPKTPQPDHSEPFTLTEAAELAYRTTMRGSKEETAAVQSAYALFRVWEKHNKIRAGRHHNDTGTRIHRRT